MFTIAQDPLERSTPERQGIASADLLRFVEALDQLPHELHSVMLLRHGKVVAEGWWTPYRPELPHLVFSLSKSFTATAVGLAVAEGQLTIDDAVLSYFPELNPDHDLLRAMRLRHLLTMTTGQVVDTWTAMMAQADGQWTKGFFSIPVIHAPGTHFLYNTGATYILSVILQRITGMKVVDYLQPRLFEPLGIEGATWQESPEGITAGGIGLCIRTEDIARFGQLYLQKGMWNGKQILSEAWAAEATAFQIANGDDAESDWAQGYGYQFWRSRHGAYRGDGVFGQYCVVMPEQDAVLAMTGGVDAFEMQSPLNVVWDLLLPAMGAAPLEADDAAHGRLVEKLAQLQLPLVEGKPTSPLVAQLAGRTYAVDANRLAIEAITLHFDEGGLSVSFQTRRGSETIACGYGTWRLSETRLFEDAVVFDQTKAAASGAWTADDTLTMIVRLIETPFFHRVVFVFAGDELMVESRINISLESISTLLLTAWRV